MLGMLTAKTPGSVKRAGKDEDRRAMLLQEQSNTVNRAFDDPARQGQYAAFLQALRGDYSRILNRAHDTASRNRKFAMARSGLIGGSRDVDSGRELRETYLSDALGAERQAQGAVMDLQGRDEASRSSLLGMVRSGTGLTAGGMDAANQMRSNAQMVQQALPASSFSAGIQSLADAYKTRVEAREKQRGYDSAFQGY